VPFFDGLLGIIRHEQNRAIEGAAARKVLADPATAGILRHWASIAPTLPAGAMISLAQTKVDPAGPLGQWLVRSAMPVALTGRDRLGKQVSPADQQATLGLISDPNRLGLLQNMGVTEQTNVFKHAARHIAALGSTDLWKTTQSGNLPDNGGGLLGYVGNVTRPAFGALQAGYEGLQAGVRVHNAMPAATDPTAFSLEGAEARAHGRNNDIALAPELFGKDVKTDQGGVIHYGAPPTPGGLVNETTIGQALQGKSLGQGIFPGGPAMEASTKAQQAAANINGHALTPGRAFASSVAQPGSKPYAIISGAVDATVAMQADPAAALLKEFGLARAARGVFSASSETAIADAASHIAEQLNPSNAQALRKWAGLGGRQGAIARSAVNRDLTSAITEKLKSNPGSLQELEDAGVLTHKQVLSAVAGRDAGLISGLRNSVHGPTALSWLNGPGRQFVDFAKKSNGLDIYLKSGRKIPANIAWKLGETTDETTVRKLLADGIGTDIRQVPYEWKHPFDSVRWLSKMPNYAVDSQDPEMMVNRAMQELSLGKVPKKEWDKYLRPLATSESRIDTVKSYTAVGNRIGDSILSRDRSYQKAVSRLAEAKAVLDKTGVETPEYRQALGDVNAKTRMARDLTTYFTKKSEEDRKLWVDQMGNTPHVPGLAIDGETTPISGPYGVSELLNRAIPVIGGHGTEGIRNLKHAVSMWAPAYRWPIIGNGIKGATYLADHLTGAFKVGTLAKLALPVRFLADEQTRMASAGIDSMFHNPMSYIAYVAGHKGDVDVTGAHFVDDLANAQSHFTQAVGRTSTWRQEITDSDKIFSKGWGTFSRDNPNYTYAWGDRLSAAHVDPVGRAVAQAIANPAETGGLDAVKQAFWHGKLAKSREDLITANLGWGSAGLGDRAKADAYIDGWVQRLHDVTAGGHEDLMKAVADGGAFASGGASPELRGTLRKLADAEVSPEIVVGPIPFEGGKVGAMRRATNAMFSALMTAPTTSLTRSPAFRQAYFQRIEELLPHLDEATRAQVIERAAEHGIRFGPIAASDGEKITLEHADTLAKAHGLKTTHDLLYYPGQRANAVDVLRNVAPFGGAWKNVLTTWSKLAAESPQVVRRVQQGVTDARESGWWFTDPADGHEKFTIVPSDVMKHLAGVPFPMVAPVKGLNIIGQGLPGVGPAVSIPASMMLSQVHGVPAEDLLRKYILPYGDPDFSGGALEQFFPGWWDKIKTAGYFAKGKNTPFLSPDQDESRILDNVAKQVYQYKLSTGTYDISNPDVQQKLMKDSLKDARMLYMWRGLAQFAAPAAPSYISQTKLKDGGLIETYLLSQDYQSMLHSTGDSYKATLQFVNKYGADRIFSTQPMTQKTIFGVPTTAQAEAWQTQHSDFAGKYPSLFGYWAPQGGAFDYPAYLDAIHTGKIEALSMDKWSQLAEARIGNAAFNELRKKLPSSPSQEQKDWLEGWRTKLTKEFPGFNRDSLKLAKDTLPQTITQLQSALRDPAVKDTPLAHAATVYLHLRDKAFAEAQNRGYKTIGGQNTADLRDWLFQNGTTIANKVPEFTTMWNYLFQNEVDTNG
jgi:hypothetical protein